MPLSWLRSPWLRGGLDRKQGPSARRRDTRQPAVERLEARDLPSFISSTSFVTGLNPLGLTTGDFNGDGKLDVASVSFGTGNISVLLGNGDGTFQAPKEFGSGNEPQAITARDLNGDGKLDLIAANYGGSNLVVLLGKGDGTFQAGVSYSTGANPTWVLTADFNGDGKLDVATADNGSTNVGILLGNGDGTLQAATFAESNFNPNTLTVGDFNGDGKLDLATANGFDSSLNLLLGNGNGTFAAPVVLDAGLGAPDGLASADLNGDGKLDLIVSAANPDAAGKNVFVLLGNGNGTFQSPVGYTAGSHAETVAAADFNGDGRPDVAVGDNDSNGVSIFLGNADGTLKTPLTYAVGIGPENMTLGDINGDGHPDVLTSNFFGSDGSLLLNRGDGVFLGAVESPAVATPNGAFPFGAVARDFNGDGLLDLAVTNRTGDAFSILVGKGDGSFAAPTTLAAGAGSAPESLAAGDLNGDGKQDLVLADTGSGGVSVVLGHGDATFQAPTFYATGQHDNQVVLADFNGDGKLDLATSNFGASTATVRLGNGDGTFGAPVTLAATGTPNGLVAVDVNGDGKMDLVTVSSSGNNVDVFLGNGNGTFQNAKAFGAGQQPGGVAAGDFNGDGKADLVVTSGVLLLGNGDGTFQNPVPVPATGGTPGGVVVKDFNGDGHADVAMIGGVVTLALGNGDGTFRSGGTFNAGRSPVFADVGDFNSDGVPDLAVTDSGAPTVTVLLSASTEALVLGGFPATVTAGAATSLTVTALNGVGKVDATYRGTIHFTSSDGLAVVPADYTFTATDAGTHTFLATLKTAGIQSLSASDAAQPGLTTTQSNITVTAAAVATLTVSGMPATTKAGVAHSFTVTAQDTFGNTATSYSGTISFASSDGQAVLPANAPLTNGVGTFSATLETVGAQTLTATDTNNPALTATQAGITVTPAAASHLTIAAPASSQSGVAFSVTVTAFDPFGNLATGYTGGIHFTSTDLAAGVVLPADTTFVLADAGTHSFSVVLVTPGNQTVTATDKATKGITGTSGAVNILPPAAVGGGVFFDANGNGTEDPGEAVLANRTVYLDLNNNGRLDAGERTTLTNAAGDYQFTGLTPGSYVIRQVFPGGGTGQTAPAAGAGYSVTLVSGDNVAGKDFGDVPYSPVAPVVLNTVIFPPHAADGATAFVNGLYRSILNRDVDAGGLNSWLGALHSGISRTAVAQGLWESAEHRGLQIDAYYRAFLHRSEGASERSAWLADFALGAAEGDVAYGFLNSAEYQGAHASGRALVSGLYQDVLGRTAQPGEINTWLGLLGNGISRDTMLRAILFSAEEAGRGVQGFYAAYLHRAADAGGQQGFADLVVAQGVRGFETVGLAILASNEFFNDGLGSVG